MRYMTDDLRIREIKELSPPAHLIREFPCTEAIGTTMNTAHVIAIQPSTPTR